jgi:hypothetical protein
MIEVKDLDGREMNRFYGRQLIEPLKGYAARRGFRTVALGGLALGDDGNVWGFMDAKPGHRLKALYRYTLKLLAWARENGVNEIRVTRDRGIDTSERLLKRSGFEPYGEADGHEIWIWRNKNG